MPKPATTTLWYFDVSFGNIGIWTRIWASSPEELEREREQLRSINSRIDSEVTPDEDVDGSCGQNTSAGQVEVELTPEGVVHLLACYGDANGE